jgi:hypothetical protein
MIEEAQTNHLMKLEPAEAVFTRGEKSKKVTRLSIMA